MKKRSIARLIASKKLDGPGLFFKEADALIAKAIEEDQQSQEQSEILNSIQELARC